MRQKNNEAVSVRRQNQERIHVAVVMTAGLAVCSIDSVAGENTWTTSGPYGGPVPQVVFDPVSPSVAYARSGKTFFKSVDGGISWTESGFDGGSSPIMGIAIDPSRGGRLYAASAAGVFRSDDSGSTFQKLAVPGHAPELLGNPGPMDVTVSKSGMTIYVKMNQGPAYVSTDAGATFSTRDSTGAPFSILIHPTNESSFYALGSGLGSTSFDLITSTDAGASWTSKPAPYVAKLDLALTAGSVWVSSITGIARSVDNGVNWTQPLPISYPWLSQDPNNPGLLYAGSARAAGTVYRYSNGTWQQLSGVLPAGGHRIAQPSGNASVMLASDAVGLHRSDDSGASWKRSDAGIGSWYVLGLAASRSRVFVAGATGEFAWNQDASAWNLGRLSNAAEFAVAITSIAADPTNPDIVMAGTQASGLFRSTDGGANWNELGIAAAGGVTNGIIEGLAFDPVNPDIVYATYRTPSTRKLLRSTDHGASFVVVHEDPGTLPEHVTSLIADPQKSGHVLIAGSNYDQITGRLLRSTDGGAHWERVIERGAWDVAFDAGNANRLYATSASGLSISEDGGATWKTESFDLASLGYSFDVEADPKRAGVVYALSVADWPLPVKYYLLRSVDAGKTWEKIAAPTLALWQPQKIVIAPDTPSIVNVSVWDRSLYSFEVAPDLAATIRGHSGQRSINTAGTYSVSVHNNSPLAATDVILETTLPASVQNISASVPSGQCSTQANTVRCSIAFVRNGQDAVVSVSYTPTALGAIDVNAKISARERDPVAGNNAATATASAVDAQPVGGGGGGGGGGVVTLPLILFLASVVALVAARRDTRSLRC
jgi:uncharacterized repeat protein (TIGR01451 family)